jgi:hypothetical protein
VQVNLPDPIVNIIDAVPSGPLYQPGYPTGYTVSWTSSNADTCDLKRVWVRDGGQQHVTIQGVSTSGQAWFPRQYSPFVTDIDFGWVYVSCTGIGGTIEEGRRLEFW